MDTTPQHTVPSADLSPADGRQGLLSAVDERPWYAVRLFTLKQEAVNDYFKQEGVESFIPMEYVDVLDKENRRRHILRPVVRNLLFLRKDLTDRNMKRLVAEVPYKISVIRKGKEDMDYYEIPAREMREFQLMCNPEMAQRQYLSEQEASLKPGAPVYVKYGPLKGITGRLVRSSKKYYLLKEIPGMGIMLKVSRWCCVPLSK